MSPKRRKPERLTRPEVLDRLARLIDTVRKKVEARRAFSCAGCEAHCCRVGRNAMLVGFFFEAVGDWQLLRFKREPASQGAIMTTGLWRFTRHPNYFGEVVLWWGLFLVTLGAPHGWWALASPVTITFLLLRVSGIPMLEKKYEGRSDFAHYRATTSAFFPWIPKRLDRGDGRAEP